MNHNDVAAARALRKVAWRLIPFMGVLYLLAFLDRVNISFAALTMNADLAFSATVFGNGAGIFFLGYVLFGVPSNFMLHRFGARCWISGIMIAWGVISGAMAFIRTPAEFYALRFLVGVAEAGFFPGMILYLTFWFPGNDRARILGAFLVALPLSSVVGAPISATLLDLNAHGLRGWQWLFLLEGIPTVAAGAIALNYLSDRPEQARWLTLSERAVLIERLQEQPSPSIESSHARHALTHPDVWRLSAVYFALLVALNGYNLWLPQIIQGLGAFSHRQIGALAMLPNLAAVLLMYAWGRHSDATERRWHVALPLILAGAGLAIAAYVREPTISMIALTLGAIGIYCALPIFWSLPSSRSRGAAAAAGIALINSLGNIGGYVGSSMMGYLNQASGGYTQGLLLLAAAAAVAALLVISTYFNCLTFAVPRASDEDSLRQLSTLQR